MNWRQLALTVCVIANNVIAAPIKAEDLPGESIYQIESGWTTHDGNTVELGTFRGHPVILSLVYLSCSYTCPTIASEIQNMWSKLESATKAQTRVVLISFDPRNDTPKVMTNFLKKRKLDTNYWTLMTNGDESKIRELAAALSFKYQKTGKKDYTHSFMIAALDSNGVLKARVDAANLDKSAMVQVLNSAAKH